MRAKASKADSAQEMALSRKFQDLIYSILAVFILGVTATTMFWYLTSGIN